MPKPVMLALVFILMTTPVLAASHHKKKHPKPTATPTKSVRLYLHTNEQMIELKPEDLMWLNNP